MLGAAQLSKSVRPLAAQVTLPPVPRLQSGFSQILSFLALVEEGDIELVAARRGLGRSTVSGHLRQVAEDYGDDLFHRLETGLAPTQAGLLAYRTLWPLMAKISNAFRILGDATFAGMEQWPVVSVPSGQPGCDLDRLAEWAAQWAARHLARHRGRLPSSEAEVSPDACDLALTLGIHKDGNGPRDRWAVIGLPGPRGWAAGDMAWSDLAGCTLAMPVLPDALTNTMRKLLSGAGVQMVRPLTDISNLFVNSEGHERRKTIVLTPLSLANHALLARHLHVALLESGPCDPTISVSRGHGSRLDDDAFETLRQALAQNWPLQMQYPALPDLQDLTIRHCRAFCSLYEERSVRRASERLCIVQPALTVQLHRIEERLATRLFDRSSRGIRPNEQANRLYNMLQSPMMQLLQSVQFLAEARKQEHAHTLRVGLMPLVDEESTSAVSVATALDACVRALPGQNVEVTEAFSAELVRWLTEGRVDLIVVDQTFNNPDIVFDTIATDLLAVIVDSASDLLPPGPVSFDHLQDLPLVLPSSRNGLRNLIAEEVRSAGRTLQPQIEIDSMATALRLVKTMRYATILPVGAVQLSRGRRQINVHEICAPRLTRRICIGRLRRAPHREATQTLIEALRTAYLAFEPKEEAFA